MMELAKFYSGKRVLVTGHTGFKGTWLCLLLEKLGAKTFGYALPADTTFYEAACPHLQGERLADIRDQDALGDFLTGSKPELVIHLAAHSTLTHSYEMTRHIFDVNVMGVVSLLENIRKTTSVKAVLVVTSDKCYRNMESEAGYDETASLGAQDPYSASKACQELVAECYRKSFFQQAGISIATARASNVLGGGDFHYDRLVPSLIHRFLKGESGRIRKPEAMRPWQSVLDVLTGYLQLLKMLYEQNDAGGVYSSPFNFGPNADGIVTVRELAEKLMACVPHARCTVGEAGTVKETNLLKISSDKAKKILGWCPVCHLDETVKMAVDFYQRLQHGESARNICLQQIAIYANLLEKASRG